MCDNIESLAINSTPEKTGVTEFVQEACSQVEVLGKHHVPSKIFVKQPDVQNLTTYFSRPRLIFTGTLPAARQNILELISTNATILAYFPFSAARLAGVYGIKYTIVYTLQVAATPFHQGMLALSWQYGQNLADYHRTNKPYACTNVPHVRLDLSVDTMVQLKVPWLNPYEFAITAGTGLPTLGYLGLNTLSSIPIVAGMNLPTYKLYIHLEDIEFSGAYPYSANIITMQSGPILANEINMLSHPYSSGMRLASSTLRFVGAHVPSLKGISGTVAWYTDALAGALKAFGFSKPTITDPIQRMLKQSNAMEHNVDLPTPSAVVGPISTNVMQLDENFSSSAVDEMALAYVLSQPCQVCYGSITSSQASGTLIYAGLVSPSAAWYRELSTAPYCNIFAPLTLNGVAGNSFYPSGLFYFGSMFRAWRGDIIYRFTFLKTKMHGGRVMVSYTPGPYSPGITDTIPNNIPGPEVSPLQPFSQCKLMDLKDNNVFEFRVPYVSSYPNSEFTDSIGVVTMNIMDPLQVSAVVSTTINFFVEMYASSDFELSIPRGPIYPAHAVGNPRTQSGETTINASSAQDTSKYTIGERIMSLKQLILIPHIEDISIGAASNYSGFVYPWYYQPGLPTTSPTPVNNVLPREAFSFGGNISKCYSFVRGGTDLHAYSTLPAFMCASASKADYGSSTATTGPNANNTPYSSLPTVNQTDTCTLHARFPGYQRLARIWSDAYDVNVWSFNGPSTVPAGSGNGIYPWLLSALPYMSINNTGAANFIRMSRNAADDAVCGMYNGPVPLYLPNLGSTATTYDLDRAF